MWLLRSFAVCGALLFLSGMAPAHEESAAEWAFIEQIRRLEPSNDKAARLRAVNELNKTPDKHTPRAIVALERCVRDDPEAEVRGRAVEVLCFLVHRAGLPCPRVVVEALLDREDLVRWHVMAFLPFETFAPGCVEVLLRGVRSDKAEVRADCLLVLGRAGRGRPPALAAMERARQDKDFGVRHSAHMALFKAREKLAEVLPYLIRLREDEASVLSLLPPDSVIGKHERVQRNLIALGSTIQWIEWQETRADELADVLVKLLADESAVQRRGAANLIGASLVKIELLAKRRDDPRPTAPDETQQPLLELLNPTSAPPRKPAPPPEPSKLAVRLEKLNAAARLRRLSLDDSDASVRAAARLALERWAALNAKRP